VLTYFRVTLVEFQADRDVFLQNIPFLPHPLSTHGKINSVLFSKTTNPTLKTPSHSIILIFTVVFFLGVSRAVHEVNYSLQYSVEVKNDWSYDSSPDIHLYGVHIYNFNFLKPPQEISSIFPLGRLTT
jgi:hypothetical protein